MSAFKSYLALEASAGSGKTFALSVRYLSLLFLGAHPHSIVALTFTNKSASEMKQRIFETLKNLEYKDELHAIAVQTNLSVEALLQRKEEVLGKLLQADIKIATLDAFFGSILRHFALHVGLLPDFKIGQRHLQEEMVERFIAQCKMEHCYETLISFGLNEDKKLNDVFELLAFLYKKKGEFDVATLPESPFSPLKPVLDILEAIKVAFNLLGLGSRGLKSLEAESLEKLLDKGFLAHEDFGYWDYKKYANEHVNALLDQLKTALKKHCEAKEAYFLGELGKLFGVFDRTLQSIAKEFGELGFDDVTNMLYTLLRQEISKDFLYFRLDGAIEHLLIDEFQDTSVVQYKILEPIIEEIRAGVGVKSFKTLFFVGDVKQSIYRFRGGAKELFGYAKESLHLDVDSLDTNYRSCGRIIHFVNETFEGKIRGYEAQKIAKNHEDGYVRVVKNDDIEHSVLEAIESFLAAGVQAKDIALLVRTNKDANVMKERVQEHFKSLHVRLEATLLLVELKRIKAIIAFVKYLYFKDALYRAQFLTLVGQEWGEKLGTVGFSLDVHPLLLVERIIKTFELFDNSVDMLSFLEVVARHEDVESFLFALEEMRDEAKSEESEGLRILTVHKSKGLEFEHVILCDGLSRELNRSESILYEYDEIAIKGVYLTMGGREHVDALYANAKEKEAVLRLEDKLNALYVAFTRAKRSLVVCAKQSTSTFEALGLEELEIGVISSPHQEEPFSYDAYRVYTPQKYGAQVKQESEEIEESNDIASIHFGVALHYMLEIIDSFEMPSFERAKTALFNRYASILPCLALEEILKRVSNLLTCKAFLSLCEGAQIYKEQGIAYEKERKQMDLLLIRSDKVIVIDYKSSSKWSEKHDAQVRLYKEALAHIYTIPIEGYICYLKADTVELIPCQ
ncbi:MAG: RecB-like helicase [Sulfurospirillaceae bacterium]|nr:RecB-like helicase [Sulfurospirillaceae bacterium]MDD2827053.1 RecB-like helicase [Sulfurospirillaceae bacterium]